MENGDLEYIAHHFYENMWRMSDQISDTGFIIPRVPERLRLGENDSYAPQIISFGPYHHRKPMIQDMEKYKWSYLEAILRRNTEIRLEHYINMIHEQVTRIRSCYLDNSPYFDNKNHWVEIMLPDGCFVVEYLLRIHEHVKDELNSMVSIQLLKSDILLLENQLPFFYSGQHI